MKNQFKNSLIRLYDSEEGRSRFGKGIQERELKQMIRYGAVGELGDHYYLFIYRDFYRDSAYYGAVIFLDQKDDLGRPVKVIGIEMNGKEQVRNVYVKAALFYLKNEFQATMSVSGSAKAVFMMAKEKLTPKQRGSFFKQKDHLQDIKLDVTGQTVKWRELKAKKVDKAIETRGLNENLKKLSPKHREESVVPVSNAVLGINLKGQSVDLSGIDQLFFQPLLLAVQSNGRYSKPRKASLKDLEKVNIQWQDNNQWTAMLDEFLNQFIYMDAQAGNPAFKIKLMQQTLFHRVAGAIFNTPELPLFCQTGKSQRDYLSLKRLTYKNITLRFAPSRQPRREQMLQFFITLTDVDGNVVEGAEQYRIILTNQGHGYIFMTDGDGQYWLAQPEDHAALYRLLDFLADQEDFHVSDLNRVKAKLKEIESESVTIQPEPLKQYKLTLLPQPVLNIFPPDDAFEPADHLTITFDYDEPVKRFLAKHPDKVVCTYVNDESFEGMCKEVLNHDPLLTQQMDFREGEREMVHYYQFQQNDPINWLTERGVQYMEKGFKIYSVKWKRTIGNSGSTIRVNFDHGIDWLQFNPVLEDPVSGKVYDIDLDNVDLVNRVVVDKKGKLHLVTENEIKKLAELYRHAERQGNRFVVPSKNHILIEKLYDERMDEIPSLKEVRAFGDRIKEFEKIEDYPLAESFNGELRGYQVEGFKWLFFLRDYGFSGCLADDMGLGKTVQTLALLETLKKGGNLKTSLLVVPVSAIPNWEAEITKFAPSLCFHRHIGSSREKDTSAWQDKDLVISSYATVRNDIEMIRQFDLDYIILDESQNIKNANSQTAKAIKVLQSKNRLALSGTPIENNSMELWSLFDFLIPGYLGTFQWFNRHIAQPIEREEDEAVADLLKRMVYPFILRRKKEEVEAELPEKIEIVSRLRMDEQQSKLYAETADYYRDALKIEMEEKGVSGSSMHILEGMLRLRQICLFPGLADAKNKGVPSAKFDHLKGLLEDILAEDHKVLIFSQFVQALHLIRDHCDSGEIRYSYIDGSTKLKDRGKMIEDFQEGDDTRVFLLSLKAGGVALNLTAADYVIIFDPWWNPAVEAQAIDRSHRIGQTRKVMVYRMVMESSIEEKMLKLQDQKRALVDQIITSDTKSFKNLNKEDIINLFS